MIVCITIRACQCSQIIIVFVAVVVLVILSLERGETVLGGG